jgi:hypothetical protein
MMMRRFIKRGHRAVMLPILVVLAGCAAAVGAAAGAAAAIAYNERNASSEIAASVAQVVRSTEAVFQEMGITLTHREVSATEAEIRGTEGDLAITVKIERESDRTSEVVVTARRGEIDYRPNRAGEILRRIIDRAS